MRRGDGARTVWLAQRGHLFPWAPVALGAGIGLYFGLPSEPASWGYAMAAGAAVGCALAAWRAGAVLSPLMWLVALTAGGMCLGGVRAHMVAEPVLGFRYYGPVEGRVIDMDRSASDAVRLTLDRVVLSNVPPGETPARVRVSLHGQQGFVTPEPGLVVALTGHLTPPGGPVEPGGFDFQRHAWFERLGAVGYTRTPVLALEPPGGGLWLFKARMWLSERVRASLPGETGAFAAAIMAGDRSAIPRDTMDALRISNLAHLLAISGLHMGLLAGVVFAAGRLVFAAIPRIGLRLPAKKIAAGVALVAAAAYLGLSGGNIATERAFVMVAVVLGAVMADRRALTLRAVAVAALIVLCLRPEALLGPGFQMSFAATTALVAVFGALRDHEVPLGPRWLRPAVSVVISSLVAGLATAPVAAAHFNQFAQYGLLANLLSVPLMGALVMPAAVLAACLMPLGLDGLALRVMGAGLDWILGVAHWVAALDGARGLVVSPGAHVLPTIALGALWVILWQGRLRWVGLVPVCAGFVSWAQTDRPGVLISETGRLVGVMTETGRALNRAKGAGFVARNWLENDGDIVEQVTAHARWPEVAATGWPVRALRGKRAAAALTGCAPGEWIVLTAEPQDGLPCNLLTPRTLRETGAVALYREDGQIRVVNARDLTGARLWTGGQ
ncbi:ComEC/Rec2 family competence protein [Roseovarius salis]|uniref:ComEC/Rec2 family competence protein n=1 Tax=Roseovarius salis TaxID=3376063 RepID=UPI0037C72FAD